MTNKLLAEIYSYLPYTYELIQMDDGTWFISVKELDGCMSDGRDANEAVANIRDAIKGYVEVLLRDGKELPLPKTIKE